MNHDLKQELLIEMSEKLFSYYHSGEVRGSIVRRSSVTDRQAKEMWDQMGQQGFERVLNMLLGVVAVEDELGPDLTSMFKAHFGSVILDEEELFNKLANEADFCVRFLTLIMRRYSPGFPSDYFIVGMMAQQGEPPVTEKERVAFSPEQAKQDAQEWLNGIIKKMDRGV